MFVIYGVYVKAPRSAPWPFSLFNPVLIRESFLATDGELQVCKLRQHESQSPSILHSTNCPKFSWKEGGVFRLSQTRSVQILCDMFSFTTSQSLLTSRFPPLYRTSHSKMYSLQSSSYLPPNTVCHNFIRTEHTLYPLQLLDLLPKHQSPRNPSTADTIAFKRKHA